MAKRPEPYQQSPTGPYWIKFQIGGVRKSVNLRTTDYKAACILSRDIYKRAQAEATMERTAQGVQPGRAKDMPLDYAIGQFWTQHVLAEALAEPSEIQRRLRTINELIGPDTMVSRIDDAALRMYRRTRQATISDRTKREMSPNSVQGELREIKRLLIWVAKELKVTLPIINWRKVMLPEATLPKRIRTLSAAENVLICREIGPDYAAVIDMANASGLRLGGFTGLTWAQVHPDSQTIQLRIKGNRFHAIHITQEIQGILDEASAYRGPEPDAPIFTFATPNGERHPITYWGFSSRWRRTITRLGIPHVTPHDLRRTFVTDFVTATNDLASASRAVGHTSTRVTEAVYLHLPSPHVRAQAEKASRDRQAKRHSVLKVS